ncbi:peptidase M3A and M3B thimet/oligopeptidase F [bacterium]|nr:peptidase M3A and M3B thimet/oligopeptidase F [bacterium]
MSDAAAFVRAHVERRAPLERELHEAEWQLNLTSDEKWEKESVRLGTEICSLLADRDAFARVKAVRETDVRDDDTTRGLERLYLDQAGNQTDPALLREIVGLEARIEMLFGRFRPVVDGTPVTENAIRQTLRDSGDVDTRRRTWEASKEIGREAAPLVREMARLRNRGAREDGFDGYHAMALELQELQPSFLFDLLARLEELTAEPYDEMIGDLFDRLGTRYGTDRAGIRPWHLADPFFQEAVAPAELNLARFYEGHDLVPLTRDAFTAMGFDIAATLERSDLFPREGKNQHAFCTHVDRLTDDVRVLCNVVPDDNWMDTMMHEFGHAVYDLGIDPDAPWMLRRCAHILSTEAIALLFGRLATNPDWMIRQLGASAADVDPLRERLAGHTRFKQLLFPRWVMVMVHFERALYADPEQDLDTLWWDLVERFQKVPRPEGAREGDWAAKLHVGLAPVYYQNYLLGDLMASQLDAFLRTELGTPFWWERAETAELLRTRLFHDGARHPWNETLRRATGSGLDPAHYVRQFVTAAR